MASSGGDLHGETSSSSSLSLLAHALLPLRDFDRMNGQTQVAMQVHWLLTPFIWGKGEGCFWCRFRSLIARTIMCIVFPCEGGEEGGPKHDIHDLWATSMLLPSI